MSNYLIQSATLDNIANAVNNITGESGALSPAQMASKLSAIEEWAGDIYIPPAPPWATGNIADIKACLDAYQAGKEVDFSAWNIGDVRSFDGFEVRLVHKFTDTDIMPARTDAQGDGTAAPNKHPYTIGTTDKLPAYAVMVTVQTGNSKWSSGSFDAQKYFNSVLDSTLTTQYNSLNNDLKSILKQFQCYVLNEGGSGGRTGYYQQLRYLSAPACKEVDITNALGNEGNYQITFDYFKTDATNRRQIPGSSYWWLRSPGDTNGPGLTRAYYVYQNGSAGAMGVDTALGTVWFGCI